jgi:hypothetical protein
MCGTKHRLGRVACWETQDSLKACFVSKVLLEHLLTKIIPSITSSKTKWVNMGNCLNYDKNTHTSYIHNNVCQLVALILASI